MCQMESAMIAMSLLCQGNSTGSAEKSSSVVGDARSPQGTPKTAPGHVVRSREECLEATTAPFYFWPRAFAARGPSPSINMPTGYGIDIDTPTLKSTTPASPCSSETSCQIK